MRQDVLEVQMKAILQELRRHRRGRGPAYERIKIVISQQKRLVLSLGGSI